MGTKTATWQITGVSEGFDSLLITTSGVNKQHVTLTFLFSDSYSPSPSITVGHPSPTPSPTSTSTPTPTPSQAPTTTPTPNPDITPTPTPTDTLSIVLTSHTSGERWTAGINYTIKWYTSGGTKPLSITLDYSVSSINGSWATIASDIVDNGSITWKTPNTTATVYLRAFVADSGNPTQSALIIRNVEVNKAGVPVSMLILQAVFVSIWGVIFVLLPGGVNSAFWMLMALTTAVYIVMYILMYLSAIKLRYSQPNVKRAFKIVGGKVGMWIISGWGIVSMIIIFILALLPPTQKNVESINLIAFEALMIVGTIGVVLIPQVIYWKRKLGWASKN